MEVYKSFNLGKKVSTITRKYLQSNFFDKIYNSKGERLQVKNLLKQAQNNIYSFGTGDASEVVSQLNIRFGMGKIMHALNKENVATDRVSCVFTPDGGITRNKERWQSGFSYGCYLRWPSLEESGKLFAFPQIKPNACGMLVAEIDDVPPVKTLCDKLHTIEKKGFSIKSSSLKLNVGVSNHFIEVCKATESRSPKVKNDGYFAIIHTSPSEFKSQLYDFDKWADLGGKWVKTPLGELLVLRDESAKKYIDKYYEIEVFSKIKREKLAKKLFGNVKILSNETHQGLSGENEIRLGVYKIINDGRLYPVAFRWNLQIFLVEPLPNLTEDILKNSGIYERSKENGVTDILASSDMLPHGGGYKIPFSSNGWRVFKNGSKYLFSNSKAGNNFIFSSPSEIPYSYRGLKIAEKIDTLKLGKVVAKLKQLYTLKY